MADTLDFGVRDEYPSRFNYSYDTSMFLEDSSSPQGAVRAYTEETREGCEPCKGVSSIYYDGCYAKEGNQCVGRSYPQCQRADPHCTQMQQRKEKTYQVNQTAPDQHTKFAIGGKKKEGFSAGDYEFTDRRMALILIIFVCVVILVINLYRGRRRKKPTVDYDNAPDSGPVI